MSLVPQLRDGSAPGKDWEFSNVAGGHSLRTDRYRYTALKDGNMLYDLIRDPNESHNLAGNPEFAKQEKQLRDTLSAILQSKK